MESRSGESMPEEKNQPAGGILWWVVPRVLAGMPMPFIRIERRMSHGAALGDYDDDLPAIHTAGIGAVVCLLNIPSDETVYRAAGFQFVCLPILDGESPTFQQANQFIRFVQHNRAQNRATAVHCEAGLGRTGTMIATYLISEGDDAETAIRRVRTVEKVAIETPRQIRFLEDYAKRHAFGLD